MSEQCLNAGLPALQMHRLSFSCMQVDFLQLGLLQHRNSKAQCIYSASAFDQTLTNAQVHAQVCSKLISASVCTGCELRLLICHRHSTCRLFWACSLALAGSWLLSIWTGALFMWSASSLWLWRGALIPIFCCLASKAALAASYNACMCRAVFLPLDVHASAHHTRQIIEAAQSAAVLWAATSAGGESASALSSARDLEACWTCVSAGQVLDHRAWTSKPPVQQWSYGRKEESCMHVVCRPGPVVSGAETGHKG